MVSTAQATTTITHILVPHRVLEHVLHQMLRRTRTDSTALSGTLERLLGLSSHGLLFPLSLCLSVVFVLEHGQCVRRHDDRWQVWVGVDVVACRVLTWHLGQWE
jgi:hypothetical protein